jgi:hypothetical protein
MATLAAQSIRVIITMATAGRLDMREKGTRNHVLGLSGLEAFTHVSPIARKHAVIVHSRA